MMAKKSVPDKKKQPQAGKLSSLLYMRVIYRRGNPAMDKLFQSSLE
ncbi:MAG: hypothetical protein WCE45_03175 [Sedimentisphaerales bacterium]